MLRTFFFFALCSQILKSLLEGGFSVNTACTHLNTGDFHATNNLNRAWTQSLCSCCLCLTPSSADCKILIIYPEASHLCKILKMKVGLVWYLDSNGPSPSLMTQVRPADARFAFFLRFGASDVDVIEQAAVCVSCRENSWTKWNPADKETQNDTLWATTVWLRMDYKVYTLIFCRWKDWRGLKAKKRKKEEPNLT